MLQLAKVFAIGVLLSAWHFGLKDPNPTNTSDSSGPPPFEIIQKVPQGLQSILLPMRFLRWTHGIIEILIIFFPDTLAPYFLPIGKDVGCIYLSLLALFSVGLAAFGAVLRITCFREMGKQFTYDLTIVENHKLVTTGPYSVVRHPSYTGAYCLHIGHVLWYISRGSWLRESEMYKVKAAWLVFLPLIWFLLSTFVMFACRPPVEDAMMKKKFGMEWEKWASEVPYSLVPGIY